MGIRVTKTTGRRAKESSRSTRDLYYHDQTVRVNGHGRDRVGHAMHKSQGQTLEKAVIELGPKEACTGLTFVCLSRAKRLADLMVEPMSFDRIGKLGNSDAINASLGEEVRLVDLAQSTRGRYTGMDVFNAVEAN